MKRKTWEVLQWDSPPSHLSWIELQCPDCGNEAFVKIEKEVFDKVEAVIGLRIIAPLASPSKSFLPNKIKCRKCKRIYSDEK
jgi:ribosomal protein S27E